MTRGRKKFGVDEARWFLVGWTETDLRGSYVKAFADGALVLRTGPVPMIEIRDTTGNLIDGVYIGEPGS